MSEDLRNQVSKLEMARDYWTTEVKRLRAEVAEQQAEVAAMRPIVEAVADGATDSETGDCCFCGWSGYPHEGNCPVLRAQMYVAQHPTTA